MYLRNGRMYLRMNLVFGQVFEKPAAETRKRGKETHPPPHTSTYLLNQKFIDIGT